MPSNLELAPLPGFIVVQQLTDPTPAGAIMVSEAHRDKPQRGRVLNVWDTDNGLGFNESDPVLRLSVGDEILFRKYSPAEIELEPGFTVLLLEQSEVYAVVTRHSND